MLMILCVLLPCHPTPPHPAPPPPTPPPPHPTTILGSCCQDRRSYPNVLSFVLVNNPLTESILKLGVVATVAMTAGSVIVAVVCVACFICCCCRCVQKRNLHDTSSDICNHHATPATSVTINNGGPHIPMSKLTNFFYFVLVQGTHDLVLSTLLMKLLHIP